MDTEDYLALLLIGIFLLIGVAFGSCAMQVMR
jgi:uncharacterized protein YneF (UPF0154 family)